MSSNQLNACVRASLLLLSSVFIVSCAEVDSEDLRSSGFHVDISVYAEGNRQSTVWVRLSTGPSIDADEINLTSGDRLQASAAGVTRTLFSDSGVYLTTFNTDAGGTDYRVSLLRSGGDVDMPDSTVTLPLAFDIEAPDANSVFNAGDLITVAWGPTSSGQVSVAYSGHCVSSIDGGQRLFGREFQVPDVGNHTVAVNTILNSFGDQSDFDPAISCPVEITVERKAFGVLDPNYGKGGSVSARQTRKRNVVLIP